MKESHRPIYTCIADDIRNSILTHELKPGDSLPTEHELAVRYDTSRVTVRKALSNLCNENLVISRQGKGYFVQKPDYTHYSMSFSLIQPYHETRTLRMTILEAPEEIAQQLSLGKNREVIFLRVLIMNSAKPVACEDKYLPYNKGFPTIESLIRHSDFPEMVDKKLTRIALRCTIQFGAGHLGEEQAQALDCRSETPVIVLKRLITSDSDTKLCYSIAWLLEEYGPISAESGYTISKPACLTP